MVTCQTGLVQIHNSFTGILEIQCLAGYPVNLAFKVVLRFNEISVMPGRNDQKGSGV